MEKKAVGILVGGGPAPGINGVIAAATIEAINRGYRVFGIFRGYELLGKGDKTCAQELLIGDVSRLHFEGGSILGTSRFNPTKNPEALINVVETLKALGIGYLVTIGGDDTATSSQAVANAAHGQIAVGHVPKTIDNDLPLPDNHPTFGFETAREAGTQIVQTLMTDAKTTGRWYFVIAMGRKAGHLALGIGVSAGATLTLIPEEFAGRKRVPLKLLTDMIVGAILKRQAQGLAHGVAVLAEGLLEKLDPASVPDLATAERDPHGHVRYADVDFGGIIKRAVHARMKELKIKQASPVSKDVGYELRCCPPNSYDREYTRVLGYGIIDYLLGGKSEAMVARKLTGLGYIPYSDLIDPETSHAKVRYVDPASVVYRVGWKYMIHLVPADFDNADLMSECTKITGLTSEQLREQFKDAAEAALEYGGDLS